MTPDYKIATSDILRGFANWRTWTRLGWQEIRRRYRRTVLGPFWFTLSLGFFIGGFAFVWAPLFHADLHEYLPFITAGMVSWTFVSTLINEGCATYTSAEMLVKQLNFPLSMLSFMLVTRNVIVLFHNLIIAVVVAVALQAPLTWASLMLFPGILIVALNGVWMSILLGMICARFRDVPQLVSNLLQVMMFVTPIFWFSEQLGEKRHIIVDYNILYHIISVVRAPIMGEFPTLLNYIVAISVALIGWIITFLIYARFRRRIAFWL